MSKLLVLIWEVMSLSSLNHLFAKAKDSILQASDTPPAPSCTRSRTNGNSLVNEWKRARNLTYSLLRCYKRPFVAAGALLAASSGLIVIGPLFLRQLVICAESNASVATVSFYLLLLLASKAAGSVLSTQYSYSCGELGVSASAALRWVVFDKMLRLSTDSKRLFTAGNISNLCTVDIDRVASALNALNQVWILPLQIATAMALLFKEVSYAMFAGLGSITLLLLANHYISVLQKAASDLTMEAKDSRMRLCAEVFGSLLIVKLSAWENDFEKKILALRLDEVCNLLIAYHKSELIWS